MRRSRVLAGVAALVTAVACGGCSFGPGIKSGAVNLRVTENFGAGTLASVDGGRIGAGETDLKLLQHHGSVATGAGDGSVTSIDGHSATGDRTWFLFVNGIQATKTASATKLYKGDHVWLDLHDAQATKTIAAVVGAFPEPFQDGTGGRRYPSTISFSKGLKGAAAQITEQFTRLHIPLSPATPGYGANDVISVNVGTWDQLYGEVAAELLKYGPGTSGVYAHFAPGGHELDLENAAGEVVKRLGPGSGLIAAIANSANDPAPTWLVTGTDLAGVRAAARAFTRQSLANHFAVAVQGSRRYPVPLTGAS